MMNNASFQYLDLRGTPCPVNFIRCRLALEDLRKNEYLKVDLDKGEPEQMVIPGLRNEGHHVDVIHEDSFWLTIHINCERS